MTDFLDLPTEIRFMVYGYAFRNSAVKFAPKLKGYENERATAAALLISTKSIYHESLPYFYQLVRINVSDILDEDTGLMRSRDLNTSPAEDLALPIDPALIYHISLNQEMFRGSGTKKFIKSLINLQSLQYFGVEPYDIDDRESDVSQQILVGPGWRDEYRDKILEVVADEVNTYPAKITGRCCDRISDGNTWDSICNGEAPIRAFIAAWAWNSMPFRLIAAVDVILVRQGHGMYGFVDLETKMMRVVEKDDPEEVVGEFRVGRIRY